MYFKPLKAKTRKKSVNLWGFDIESHTSDNLFTLGVFANEHERIVCKTPSEVIKVLDSEKMANAVIIATNLQFDFLGTFKHLDNRDFSVVERNGIFYTATYFQHGIKKKGISFYDTVRFFPASVLKLGKIMEVPKMEHPSCFNQEPQNEIEERELTDYCENDARISYLFYKNFILKFCLQQGISTKCAMASMSLADFRTNYLHHTIKVEDQDIHRMTFASYYGGRTEVFRRGTYKDVNVYDYNSLYPSVMVNELPNPQKSFKCAIMPMHCLKNFEGVCYVEGTQEKTFVPLLPVRMDGKLIFPTGRIKGFYTFIELREAIKNGFHITKLGEGVYYTKTFPFFKEFVTDKYNIRLQQKADGDPLQLMTKLSMNSLYGKFGFDYTESSSVVQENQMNEKMLDKAKTISPLRDGFFAINQINDVPPCYSFPIWASYITAYARIKIWKALVEHQENLLYCDTDSIFLRNGVTVPCSDKLGELGFEYNAPIGVFVKPKFYYTEVVKIKGVKSKLSFDEHKEMESLDFDKFINIIEGATFYENFFVKYRTALRSNQKHKFGLLQQNQVIVKSKKLSNEDTKRNWSRIFDWLQQEESLPLKLINE
jgi:DNA polymerase elongation subunit (family B)